VEKKYAWQPALAGADAREHREPAGTENYWKRYEEAAAAGLTRGCTASDLAVHGQRLRWPSSMTLKTWLGTRPIESGLSHLDGDRGRVRTDFRLQLVLIEAGLPGLPSRTWRLDKHWNRLSMENADI